MTGKSGTGHFLGKSTGGNPYDGDNKAGINYDWSAEINHPPAIDQETGWPVLNQPYTARAKRLAQILNRSSRIPLKSLLDIGSGTGITTLELIAANPQAQVVGIEPGAAMVNTASYKFNQLSEQDEKAFLEGVDNEKLLAYWDSFRARSKVYKDEILFLKKSLQDIGTSIPNESIDGATANQVLHWIKSGGDKDAVKKEDLGLAFSLINPMLKPNAQLLWTTAIHFYDDPRYPAREYGMRFNDFIKYSLADARKTIKDLPEYAPPLPLHTFDTVKENSEKNGFDTVQLDTYLRYYDLKKYIADYVPAAFNECVSLSTDAKKFSNEELQNIIKESISKTIHNEKAMNDDKHKYEVTPIFSSVKRR